MVMVSLWLLHRMVIPIVSCIPIWHSLGTNEATLTLTDTTVSKVSDGSLIGRTSIDQVLTVGETVRSETSYVIASAQVWSDNLTNITPNGSRLYMVGLVLLMEIHLREGLPMVSIT